MTCQYTCHGTISTVPRNFKLHLTYLSTLPNQCIIGPSRTRPGFEVGGVDPNYVI